MLKFDNIHIDRIETSGKVIKVTCFVTTSNALSIDVMSSSNLDTLVYILVGFLTNYTKHTHKQTFYNDHCIIFKKNMLKKKSHPAWLMGTWNPSSAPWPSNSTGATEQVWKAVCCTLKYYSDNQENCRIGKRQ